MSSVLHLDDNNFDQATSGIALIDFWAEWCGPCRMLGPVLDQVAEEVGDKAVVAKINVDESQQLAMKYSVKSIPAIFVLKDGEVVNQFVGVQDKAALISAINEQL